MSEQKIQVRRAGEKITAIRIAAGTQRDALERLTEAQMALPQDRALHTIRYLSVIVPDGDGWWLMRPK